MTLILKVKRLTFDAFLPVRATDGSAGLDFALPSRLTTIDLTPGDFVKIGIGLCLEIPVGYFGYFRPRSGMATKHGLVLRSSNIVDSDYRGEIGLCCYNLSRAVMELRAGERIAQMVLLPVPDVRVVEVNELTPTGRGQGGFGSTGK